jgi:osmotically-inducible protein OsmY
MRRKGDAVSPTGSAIEKSIQTALEDDPRVQPFHLHMLMEDHQATLSGIVDNLRAKKAAGQDAVNTWGVSEVQNYIKVRPVQRWKDANLAQRVRDTMRQDPYLADDEIRVYVRHGVVYLTGGTASRFERLRAEDVATRIRGVVDVRNQIIPSYGQPPKSDREMKADILTYFLWDPRADRDVHLSVKDGMATLTGSISSWTAREAAEKHAYDGGARNVFNDLIIKS